MQILIEEVGEGRLGGVVWSETDRNKSWPRPAPYVYLFLCMRYGGVHVCTKTTKQTKVVRYGIGFARHNGIR